jgi:hypothetical protein
MIVSILHPRRRSKVSIENEQATMSASYFQVISQLQHLAQAATTHVTTNSKQGFDLIVAAAVSDNHLAGGIDCLIAHAQYDQLVSALHFPLRLCLSGLHISSSDLILSHSTTHNAAEISPRSNHHHSSWEE